MAGVYWLLPVHTQVCPLSPLKWPLIHRILIQVSVAPSVNPAAVCGSGNSWVLVASAKHDRPLYIPFNLPVQSWAFRGSFLPTPDPHPAGCTKLHPKRPMETPVLFLTEFNFVLLLGRDCFSNTLPTAPVLVLPQFCTPSFGCFLAWDLEPIAAPFLTTACGPGFYCLYYTPWRVPVSRRYRYTTSAFRSPRQFMYGMENLLWHSLGSILPVIRQI